jgi:hypothetical protein
LSTPAAGDGISASTLSVEISNSGSSRCTRSPTFFIQRVTVPSAIDSPIWGMITSVMATPQHLPECGALRSAWAIFQRDRSESILAVAAKETLPFARRTPECGALRSAWAIFQRDRSESILAVAAKETLRFARRTLE